MRRRNDLFVRPNSISDIEDLLNRIDKEKLEYKEKILKKKIEELSKYIMALREEFLNFLIINNINPNLPILNTVTSDEVVPDTVSEYAMETIPIEKAMLPNIPNNVFLKTINLLKEKYEPLENEIENYVDKMLKARLKKAELEKKLEEIIVITSEYREKIKEKKEEYNKIINNLEMIKDLYQNLLDFKVLFNKTPSDFTADIYIKFYQNQLDRYSAFYYEKKKIIKNIVDELQNKYYVTAVDNNENGISIVVLKDISSYFDFYKGDNLPDKYVDAVPLKKEIIEKLNKFSEDINKIINNNKISLDLIREVKGIGNSTVEGLISSVNEVSKSFATQKKLEHTTLEDINNSNYTVKLAVNQKINNIKRKLQLGVDQLDESFIRLNKDFLRKIALTIDFPTNFNYDKTSSLEEHIREKVRLKYGGQIPFCDEEVFIDEKGNKKFIKKSELKNNKSKKEEDKNKLLEKTKLDLNIWV
jgi:hypothetical protein